MKFKGINRNIALSNMPEGFGIDAKNGNNSHISGASVNEGGFKVFQKLASASINKYNIPFTLDGVQRVRRIVGEIEVDLNRFVIISAIYNYNLVNGTNQVATEIGLLEEDGNYITVINDYSFTSTNKLSLDLTAPVTGEFTKNYLNNLIVAITNGITYPYLINIDYYIANPPSTSFAINEIKLFPDVTEVNTSFFVNDSGGTIDNGIYYFQFGYKNKDLSVSSGTLLSNPISVFNTPTGADVNSFHQVAGDELLLKTNKSITLTLTNINPSFEELVITVIIKRNGVSVARELLSLPINGTTLTTTITSSEGTELSLAEVLTPKSKFKAVGKFTQVYNRLYAMSPTVNTLRELQPVALNTRIKWKSVISEPYTDGDTIVYQDKTFLHKEVYAFNLCAVLIDGSITEAFTIPWNHGDPVALGYKNTSTAGTAQGLNVKKYEIEDTIVVTSTPLKEGNTGYWENKNEYYPNLPEYGALAGQPVRHHRMPSINFMANLYSDSQYGLTKLDRLGIIVENVVIPNNLKPFIKNWFITFAQRSASDSTVLGQSIGYFQATTLNNMSTNKYYGDADKSTFSTGTNNIYTGNVINMPVTPYLINADLNYLTEEALLRFYDLNLLVNNPDIAPAYISNELYINTGFDFIDAFGFAVDDKNHKASIMVDMINGGPKSGGTPVISSDWLMTNIDGVDTRYRKVSGYKYLANNVIDGRYDNQVQEDCLLISIDCTKDYNFPVGVTSYAFIQAGVPGPGDGSNGQFAYITTSGNVYEKVSGAWILRGNRRKGTRSIPICLGTNPTYFSGNLLTWTGNSQLSWYSTSAWNTKKIDGYLTTLMANPGDLYRLQTQKMVNMGIMVDVNATSQYMNGGDAFVTYNSFHAAGWGGTRSDKLFDPADVTLCLRSCWLTVTESQVNNQLRGFDETDVNNQFFPKSQTAWRETNRLDIHTNKLYNNDYNSLNNLIPILPYNPNKQVIAKNNFRINRTVANIAEAEDFGWRNWLINDYYDVARNKGILVNIEGQDRDLFIHTEKALFKTVGNEQLNIDRTTAFIGAGNIFERPAIEFIPSRQGSIGTQDMLSCKLTEWGYISVDREAKGINLIYGNNRINLSDDTLYRWLIEALDYDTKVYYTSSLFFDVGSNPYSSGKGIHIGVDPQYKRILITKLDYELTVDGKNLIQAGGLTYTNGRWLQGFGSNKTEVLKDDTRYFTDKSWTIAYEIEQKAFTFFQDYIPHKFLNSRFYMFAAHSRVLADYTSAVSVIFKTGQANCGIYDKTVNLDIDTPVTETATPKPFYIVPVFGFDKTFLQIVNVTMQLDVLKSADNNITNPGRYHETPPTSILIFNSSQCTKETTLVNFGNDPSNFFSYNIRKTKGVWSFNDIKDWLAESVYNSGEPFITNFSVLDNTKIDLSKAPFKITPLIDQWVAVKILYNNQINAGISKEFRILQVDISALPVSR